MKNGREELRERAEQIAKDCLAHPKETVETALLVALLFLGGLWYVSGEDEAVTVQPKESAPAPQTERKPAGARVAVKGAELAAEDGELTNPFSFEHETRTQMATALPKAQKEKTDEKATKPAVASVPSVPANVPIPGTTVNASSATPLELAEPPLLLKGVATSDTDAMAVIIENGTRKFVHIGEEVAGMSVTAIDRDSVTLTGNGGTTVLQLPTH